jgi:fatty-acyl-CoA synthase
MKSTMQQYPLLVSGIFNYGRQANGDSQVTTFLGDHYVTAKFSDVAKRACKLANALKKAGVGRFDRVATFCMNHQQHLEAYLAVPSMGSVLHTLNVRLFPDQLSYIIRDAEDKIIIFDGLLAPALLKVQEALSDVKLFVQVGPSQDDVGRKNVVDYEEFISDEFDDFDFPMFEEDSPASMCYTSGTTGNPKGVVYSHRSTYLHSLMVTSAMTLGINYQDRALVIVPMFHVNAWGTPYACWMSGADMIMPSRFLQAQPLAKMFSELKPTISAGVPTIWNDLLNYSESHEVDLSSVRLLVAGGSAVPKELIRRYKERFGVTIAQGWGMTETSPLCALSQPPRDASEDEKINWYAKTGKVVPGVEIRITDDNGEVLPNDGRTQGEFEVRGPWITGSYFNDPSMDRFNNGWLRTGDVGYLTPDLYMQISDRSKDVIKTGGEWISSVDLENAIMAHEDVLEAAVIAIPDPKWEERPLACVVLKEGKVVNVKDLKEFLTEKVAKWWIPEYWAFLPEIPKTSVGKFDKKVLRARYRANELNVINE